MMQSRIVDLLGDVPRAAALARCFAERHPSQARRILGRPPVFIVDKPAVVASPPVKKPEPPKVVDRLRLFRPSPADVIEAVGNAFDVSRGELLSNWKPNRIARPRMACYHLIHEFCRIGVPPRKLSQPEIGRIFKRDHTSVLSGLRRTEALFDHCPDFLDRYEAARLELVSL